MKLASPGAVGATAALFMLTASHGARTVCAKTCSGPRHSRGMVVEALGVGNCRDFRSRNVRWAIISPGGRTAVGRSAPRGRDAEMEAVRARLRAASKPATVTAE